MKAVNYFKELSFLPFKSDVTSKVKLLTSSPSTLTVSCWWLSVFMGAFSLLTCSHLAQEGLETSQKWSRERGEVLSAPLERRSRPGPSWSCFRKDGGLFSRAWGRGWSCWQANSSERKVEIIKQKVYSGRQNASLINLRNENRRWYS